MNKSPFNTLAGVTTLKKGEKGEGSGKTQVRKQHAGDVGKRATATRAQDKSGYSRSGKDFINVHSFTANTRLSPSLANTLGPSISSAVQGKGKQSKNNTTKNQIGVDAGGNPIFLPDGFEVTSELIGGGDLPSIQQTWDDMEVDGDERVNPISGDRYPNNADGFNTYKTAAEKYNKDNPSSGGGDGKFLVKVIGPDGEVLSSWEDEGGYKKE